MRFAAPLWLFGTAAAAVVALLLVLGGLLLLRAVRRFGDEAQVTKLLTGRSGPRRALKGALLVLAVAAAFLAAAQPQYGRGTRLIPATNLDVVLVLDYSKSMYARDVKPSRIDRAKADVSELIAALPGARFGAVAFAGQPMAFPLTSDGAAIAQFFRQLSPNDMPVGGTAIARALEAGRDLLQRDPLSQKHRRVLVLVTDGEDLEGDPVAVARDAHLSEITVHVVQIGGRTPEPVPEVDAAGTFKGLRYAADGSPLMTALSAEGEAQLAQIAEVSGGSVVRSSAGATGIRDVAQNLKRMMTEELSERVETVYADVFMYPLGLCILLLLLESFVGEAPRRRTGVQITGEVAPTRRRRRRRDRAALTLGALLGLFFAGCELDAGDVFVRHSPKVDEAIGALDAGNTAHAIDLLTDYLATGRCEEGQIGTPATLRDKPNAGLDLGLGLFRLGEQYGARFGEEPPPDPTPEQQVEAQKRRAEVDCALRIVAVLGGDGSLPVDLRARAHYLAGNLEFLRAEYKAAVGHYDQALKLIPGIEPDAGDLIGADAAYNRSIALRRIEEQEPPDAGPPDAEPPDGSDDPDGGEQPDGGPPDGGQDGGQDGGDSDDGENGGEDAGPDGSDQSQDDQDGGSEPPEEPEPEQQPPSQSANQDARMLDMLERAPTFQEHNAKNRALQGRVSGMEDK